MKSFNFRKRVKRNVFSTVFQRVGKRRTVQTFALSRIKPKRKFWMAEVRRGYQGYKNKTFTSCTAIKLRIKYGRKKPVHNFRGLNGT